MPGAVQVSFAFGNILDGQRRAAQVRMTRIATEYANLVKTLMRSSPASGRTYRRGKVSHQASAPGEPPAPDMGALVQSITWRVRGYGTWWVAEIGSRLKYALYLEFGAAAGAKGKSGKIESVRWILYPRPAWGPAMTQMRARIPVIMREGV